MPTGNSKFPLRTDSGMSKDTCGSRKALDFLEGRTCQATLLDWEPTLTHASGARGNATPLLSSDGKRACPPGPSSFP